MGDLDRRMGFLFIKSLWLFDSLYDWKGGWMGFFSFFWSEDGGVFVGVWGIRLCEWNGGGDAMLCYAMLCACHLYAMVSHCYLMPFSCHYSSVLPYLHQLHYTTYTTLPTQPFPIYLPTFLLNLLYHIT